MQYHLNGFNPGDPEVFEPAARGSDAAPLKELPARVDVLIVGCGPAGLTLAAQLAKFPDIQTCIVEQKPGRLVFGQADGIACRTVEMFEAFGFSERVLKEAYWVNETSFWKPDDDQRGKIKRSGKIQDSEDGLSEFPHVILSQARVHDFYLDAMEKLPAQLVPHYSRKLINLEIEPNIGAKQAKSNFPVSATFERIDLDNKRKEETVRARMVVGCDGARSTVRRSLGLEQKGDSANQAWGVMDILAVTDFPDIRLKTAIHSANEGSMLIIPREGGYLVRFYIELDKLNENERVSDRNITSNHLIAAAQRILHPYRLEVKEVAWWSVYEIGQRLCDKFDDVADGEINDRNPCVFITGDACHTHSPKAGQGMNVSMGDSFNLGWKLASVLRGHCTPEILHTYSLERQGVAKELIDFDRVFAKMFSARPKDRSNDKIGNEKGEGVDPQEFQKYFAKQGRFTAGTAVCYSPSIISAEPIHQHLVTGLKIGMRFHSAPVIRLADAKPVQLGHTIRADGRWRIFAFSEADNPTDPNSKIQNLCIFLADASESPIRKFTPTGTDIDSVIDVRGIFQQSHRELEIEAMPALLLPGKGCYGQRDYEKLYCSDLKSGNDIFNMRGINRDQGCMVIVRPDQYVAHVLPLDSHGELAVFFEGFMKAGE